MVKDIWLNKLEFLRKGAYRYSTMKTEIKMYIVTKNMFQYMIGVALSQFLWQNHKEMFEF